MTLSYSHNPNNHLSRRASVSAAPYTIPDRHTNHGHSHNSSIPNINTPFSPPHSSNVHIPQHATHLQPTNQHGHSSVNQAFPSHYVQAPNYPTGNNNTNLSSSVPVLSRDFVVRRISEGESGRLKEELKCEACGKGYKHISSLAKHLWEHTPEWNVTKKLLISKHQQVQLLEAASILVSMNEVTQQAQQLQNNGITPIDEEKENISEAKGSHNADNETKIEEKHQKSYNSSSRSPSPFTGHQQNYVTTKIKSRTHSMSQYPPSSNSYSSPSKTMLKPTTGGFLDVPKSKSGLSNETAVEDDEENDNSVDDRSNDNDDDDDDNGVFGDMD